MIFGIALLLSNLNIKKCNGYIHLFDTPFGNAWRSETLNAHNALRSWEAENGFGGAVFMLKLVYDTHLEIYAKNWTIYLCEKGLWQHSSREPPFRVAHGENLYANSIDYSQKVESFSPYTVVKKWWDERENFDWNESDPHAAAQALRKEIGHWTQVVRGEASMVGCAAVTGCNGTWKTYFACHYDHGNAGWFPYWPVGIPAKIPNSVPQIERRRCGRCPRGYERCGVTSGSSLKRDSFLCIGMWNLSSALPPPNLYEISMEEHNTYRVGFWKYMTRDCNERNGKCALNSHCVVLPASLAQRDEEPRILLNQCLCHNFDDHQGYWLERNSCVSPTDSTTQSTSLSGFFQDSHSFFQLPYPSLVQQSPAFSRPPPPLTEEGEAGKVNPVQSFAEFVNSSKQFQDGPVSPESGDMQLASDTTFTDSNKEKLDQLDGAGPSGQQQGGLRVDTQLGADGAEKEQHITNEESSLTEETLLPVGASQDSTDVIHEPEPKFDVTTPAPTSGHFEESVNPNPSAESEKA